MQTAKKDYKTEIIRIFSNILVIIYHIRFYPIIINGNICHTSSLIECFCSMCVTNFFILSGFFIYDHSDNILKDWVHIIKSFIFRIFIPAFIVNFFCITFDKYLSSDKNFIFFLYNTRLDNIFIIFINSFKSFFFNTWTDASRHLWYIYAYEIILLSYPLIRIIIKMKNEIVILILFLIITIHTIGDYLSFHDDFTINIFIIIIKPILCSFCGYLLYKNIKNNKNLKIFNILLLLILFLIIFIIKYHINNLYLLNFNGDWSYNDWRSVGSMLLSLIFIRLVYCIEIKNSFLYNCILFLGKKTFGIYLLHFPIAWKMQKCNFFLSFQSYYTSNPFEQICYIFVCTFIIYSFSLVLLLFIEYMNKKIKELYFYIKLIIKGV